MGYFYILLVTKQSPMQTLTKEELIYSFRGDNTKRRDAIYNFYQEWFDLPLTAPMLAKRISADLGIPIGTSLIYHIRSKHKPVRAIARSSQPAQTTAKGAASTPPFTIPDLADGLYTRSTIEFLTD